MSDLTKFFKTFYPFWTFTHQDLLTFWPRLKKMNDMNDFLDLSKEHLKRKDRVAASEAVSEGESFGTDVSAKESHQ